MFKKILQFPKMVVLFIALFMLYVMAVLLRTINTVVILFKWVLRITATIVVLVTSIPVSIVARLIGFLAFIIVNGVTRGYVVSKDEVSIGGKVARQMEIELNSEDEDEAK